MEPALAAKRGEPLWISKEPQQPIPTPFQWDPKYIPTIGLDTLTSEERSQLLEKQKLFR